MVANSINTGPAGNRSDAPALTRSIKPALLSVRVITAFPRPSPVVLLFPLPIQAGQWQYHPMRVPLWDFRYCSVGRRGKGDRCTCGQLAVNFYVFRTGIDGAVRVTKAVYP